LAGLALALLATATLLPPARAQALPAGVQQVTQVEGITEYRLPNGLQVLLVPDATKPSTTVNLTIRVGSRHENYGETGMAHLLEHLIFKGTPTQRNAMAEFSRRGLRFNGTTGFDRTNYFASFSASDENLRWYLAWQADAMVNSLIARSDLDTEMTVVRNEMESGENNPVRATIEQTLAAMYQWHNYGKTPIGARPMWRTSTSRACRPSTACTTSPTTPPWWWPASSTAPRCWPGCCSSFGPIPKPQRVLPRTYTLDPVQKGERQWQCAARAARRSCWHGLARRAGGPPRLRRHRRAAAGAGRMRRRAGCTSAWSKPSWRPAASASPGVWPSLAR
jgi:zinc protease